jgi:hypothetical protein
MRFARNRTEVADKVPTAIAVLDDYRGRIERTTAIASLLGVEGSATTAPQHGRV